MRKVTVLIIISYFLTSTLAFSQSLSDGIAVFKSAGWTVLRTTSTMTDKTSCTGILNGDYGIQLSESALYLRIQGGVRSITLRFDEDAPEKLRLPSEYERKGIVALSGSEFSKALGSTRLRTQVLTVLDRLDQKDLNLTGISEAHRNIQSGCPGEPIDTSRKAAPASLCSKEVTERMKRFGLSDESVKSICTN
jgi:hypothetical protein